MIFKLVVGDAPYGETGPSENYTMGESVDDESFYASKSGVSHKFSYIEEGFILALNMRVHASYLPKNTLPKQNFF